MRPLPTGAPQEKSHVPIWREKRYLERVMRPQKLPDIPVSLEGNTEVPSSTSSEPLLPSWSPQEGRILCFVWKGFMTFAAHLRMRPVSWVNSRLATWVVPNAERPRFPSLLPGTLYERMWLEKKDSMKTAKKREKMWVPKTNERRSFWEQIGVSSIEHYREV